MNFRELINEEWVANEKVRDLATGVTRYIELFKNPSLHELKSIERQMIKKAIKREHATIRGLLVPYRLEDLGNKKIIDPDDFDKIDLYIWDGSNMIHDSILKHFKDKIGTDRKSKTFTLIKNTNWSSFRILNSYLVGMEQTKKAAELAEKKFHIGFEIR